MHVYNRERFVYICIIKIYTCRCNCQQAVDKLVILGRTVAGVLDVVRQLACCICMGVYDSLVKCVYEHIMCILCEYTYTIVDDM